MTKVTKGDKCVPENAECRLVERFVRSKDVLSISMNRWLEKKVYTDVTRYFTVTVPSNIKLKISTYFHSSLVQTRCSSYLADDVNKVFAKEISKIPFRDFPSVRKGIEKNIQG